MKIGVYGSAAGASGRALSKAREVGRQLALRGHVLITGGCPGLPYEAVKGASAEGGECIAFSPGIDLEDHTERHGFPTEGFSEFVFLPEVHGIDPLVRRKIRNVNSVASVDAAIIIGGRIGTMNEFTIAFDLGKNIGVLKESGGISDRAIMILVDDASKKSKSRVIYDEDPARLVERLLEL